MRCKNLKQNNLFYLEKMEILKLYEQADFSGKVKTFRPDKLIVVPDIRSFDLKGINSIEYVGGKIELYPLINFEGTPLSLEAPADVTTYSKFSNIQQVFLASYGPGYGALSLKFTAYESSSQYCIIV